MNIRRFVLLLAFRRNERDSERAARTRMTASGENEKENESESGRNEHWCLVVRCSVTSTESGTV